MRKAIFSLELEAGLAEAEGMGGGESGAEGSGWEGCS